MTNVIAETIAPSGAEEKDELEIKPEELEEEFWRDRFKVPIPARHHRKFGMRPGTVHRVAQEEDYFQVWDKPMDKADAGKRDSCIAGANFTFHLSQAGFEKL